MQQFNVGKFQKSFPRLETEISMTFIAVCHHLVHILNTHAQDEFSTCTGSNLTEQEGIY